MQLDALNALLALLQFVTTALLALVGWHASRQAARLDALAADLNALQLKVAEHHPTKAELVQLREEIRDIVADAVQPIRAELSLLSRIIGHTPTGR